MLFCTPPRGLVIAHWNMESQTSAVTGKKDLVDWQNMSRMSWVGAWCAGVCVAGAVSVVAGAAITSASIELWLAAGIVPPAVMLLVWRGAPPLTAAEVLYAVDSQSEPEDPRR